MCSRGLDAAINDLELWQKIEKYKEKDKEIACFALEKLELHLWSSSFGNLGIVF